MSILEQFEALIELRDSSNDIDRESSPSSSPPTAPGADILAIDQLMGLGPNTISGDHNIGLELAAIFENNSGFLIVLVVVDGAQPVLDLDPQSLQLSDQHLEELGSTVAVHAGGIFRFVAVAVAVAVWLINDSRSLLHPEDERFWPRDSLPIDPVVRDQWVFGDSVVFLCYVWPVGIDVLNDLRCDGERIACNSFM